MGGQEGQVPQREQQERRTGVTEANGSFHQDSASSAPRWEPHGSHELGELPCEPRPPPPERTTDQCAVRPVWAAWCPAGRGSGHRSSLCPPLCHMSLLSHSCLSEPRALKFSSHGTPLAHSKLTAQLRCEREKPHKRTGRPAAVSAGEPGWCSQRALRGVGEGGFNAVLRLMKAGTAEQRGVSSVIKQHPSCSLKDEIGDGTAGPDVGELPAAHKSATQGHQECLPGPAPGVLGRADSIWPSHGGSDHVTRT